MAEPIRTNDVALISASGCDGDVRPARTGAPTRRDAWASGV